MRGAGAQQRSRLGSPCLQGELDFVAASRQKKTERIFVRLELIEIKNEEKALLAKQLFLISYFEHRFEHGKILLEHGLSTV